jgi:hypothetical protein
LSKNSSTKNIQHEEFSNGEESRNTDERSEEGVSAPSSQSEVGSTLGVFSSSNSFGTFSTKSTESGPKNLDEALTLAYTLYDILTERRKKEGKILFESSETVFEFATQIP